MTTGAAIRDMPTGSASIDWMEDKPYSKTSFLEKINRNTEDKICWLYTFNGYAESIYEQDKKSYVDVAQKNMTGSFVTLWPWSSTPTNTAILEISKREKDGRMPETNESANKLNPTMLLSYKWHTITIPLENVLFQNNQWFDVLDKTYESINTYIQKYETIEETEGKEIHDFVIKTLQEKNYLTAKLGEKAKKTIWGMSGKLMNTLKWLFWSNTEKISVDESI